MCPVTKSPTPQVTLAEAIKQRLPVHPSQDLDSLPDSMLHLQLTERNGHWWVTPWFVAKTDEGLIDFRIADWRKWADAVMNQKCWVCGGHLGVHLTFVLGPMCIINRTTAEPPCHAACAVWSVCNCPFLAHPEMIRRPAPRPEGAQDPAGIGIPRNPGVSALWPTRGFHCFDDGKGKKLIRVDEPSAEVHWYAEGRKATRAEIETSIRGGLPILTELAESQGPEAVFALFAQYNNSLQFLPAA